MPSLPRLQHRPHGRLRPAGSLGLIVTLGALAALVPLERQAMAGSGPILEVVRSFCLSAFETELAQTGKTAPDGMANFACSCVADRISSGSSIAAARTSCRAATAKRYPI
jgi:hypothetical protein